MANGNPVVPVMDWTEDAVTQEICRMEGEGRIRVRIMQTSGEKCEILGLSAILGKFSCELSYSIGKQNVL